MFNIGRKGLYPSLSKVCSLLQLRGPIPPPAVDLHEKQGPNKLKWSQNDSKMVLKWSQNGPKMVPHCSKPSLVLVGACVKSKRFRLDGSGCGCLVQHGRRCGGGLGVFEKLAPTVDPRERDHIRTIKQDPPSDLSYEDLKTQNTEAARSSLATSASTRTNCVCPALDSGTLIGMGADTSTRRSFRRGIVRECPPTPVEAFESE